MLYELIADIKAAKADFHALVAMHSELHPKNPLRDEISQCINAQKHIINYLQEEINYYNEVNGIRR